ALNCTHRLAAGRRGKNRFRAAECLQRRRRVLRSAVDVMLRTELPRQRLFVRAAGDCSRSESHFRRKLHTEMAKSADAEHGDEIAGPRAAVAQGIESRDAGAHQWGSL